MSSRTVLITGCSSGIGKELAKEFQDQGWEVFAGARRVEKMKELKERGIYTIPLDVTNEESAVSAKEFIEKKTGGKLDMLFNNAGQSATFPATDLTDEDAKQCYDVNVFGVMRMVRVFSPLLIAAKGTIANTGSVAGKLQAPFSSAYSSSKAALHQYANVLRVELAPFGVNVVTTYTAAVKTDIADTRPLPSGSLYQPIEDGIAERRTMARNNSPMEAEVYAKKVVHQLLRSKKPFFWEGNRWFMIWFALTFLPRKFLDWVIMRKFKLADLAAILQRQKKDN